MENQVITPVALTQEEVAQQIPTLSEQQIEAISGLLTQMLRDPQTLLAALDNLDVALADAGLSPVDVADLREYVIALEKLAAELPSAVVIW